MGIFLVTTWLAKCYLPYCIMLTKVNLTVNWHDIRNIYENSIAVLTLRVAKFLNQSTPTSAAVQTLTVPMERHSQMYNGV